MFNFRVFRSVTIGVALLLFPVLGSAACDNWTQPDGSIYRICMPAVWNGDLVVFAHGFVSPTEPIGIPESQLVLPDGTSLPDLITGAGYAFATTSFPVNGLAVVEGVEDVVKLVTFFGNQKGTPGKVYLTGASEGGLIVVKALEEYPGVFSGGLAACGPIGDFRRQIDHVGDARAVFDYFFPGVIPPSAISIPQEVMDDWNSVYVPNIATQLQNHPLATAQVISVTKLPVGLDLATVGESILSVLWYDVFATNDTVAKLRGNPYDNTKRWYSGSFFDLLLNLRIERYKADKVALNAIRKYYQTTGDLPVPLVTLHTVSDPVVPYWHETLYAQKVANQHESYLLTQIPVLRYGHCNFTGTEVLGSFLLLVSQVSAH